MIVDLTISTARLRILLSEAHVALSDEAVLRFLADPDHSSIGLEVLSDDHPSLGKLRTVTPKDGYL